MSYYAAFYLQDFRAASIFIMHAATLREIESKHVCIINIRSGAIAEYPAH